MANKNVASNVGPCTFTLPYPRDPWAPLEPMGPKLKNQSKANSKAKNRRKANEIKNELNE